MGQDWEQDIRIILFVTLRDSVQLTEELSHRISRTIRRETSPRHVPAKIVQVKDIPYTISGKKVEIAVKKIIHGQEVNNMDALANPEALAYFQNRDELKT